MLTKSVQTRELLRFSLRWAIVTLLLALPSQAQGATVSGKVFLRDDFTAPHRKDLLERLRVITGWDDLDIEENGALHWGAKQPSRGSRSARELLTKSVFGPSLVILEDTSNRPDIVFCRVVPGEWTAAATHLPSPYVIQIDFYDFQQVLGDQQARASFDVGWGVLHELDHVVNDSVDSEVLGHAGECEQHINAMRREMNLPERAEYFCTLIPFKSDGNFSARFVRLAFDQSDQSKTKKRRYWLIWDAAAVGAMNEKGQIALVR